MNIPKNSITEQHLTQDLRGKINSLQSEINNINTETTINQVYFNIICAEDVKIHAIGENSSGFAVNANANDDIPAIGVSYEVQAANIAVRVLQFGKITIPGASFEINKDIWLTEQIGAGINLTTTKPGPSTGRIIQRIGKSLSVTDMLIEIGIPEKVY